MKDKYGTPISVGDEVEITTAFDGARVGSIWEITGSGNVGSHGTGSDGARYLYTLYGKFVSNGDYHQGYEYYIPGDCCVNISKVKTLIPEPLDDSII